MERRSDTERKTKARPVRVPRRIDGILESIKITRLFSRVCHLNLPLKAVDVVLPGHLERLVSLSNSSVPGRPDTDCVLNAIPDRGMRSLDLA